MGHIRQFVRHFKLVKNRQRNRRQLLMETFFPSKVDSDLTLKKKHGQNASGGLISNIKLYSNLYRISYNTAVTDHHITQNLCQYIQIRFSPITISMLSHSSHFNEATSSSREPFETADSFPDCTCDVENSIREHQFRFLIGESQRGIKIFRPACSISVMVPT